MSAAADKLASIVHSDKHVIYKIESHLSTLLKKENVLEGILKENEEKIKDRLLQLGVSRNAPAKEVYDALISKIEADDRKIFKALGNPRLDFHEDCVRVLSVAQEASGVGTGFFLKKEKAADFLRKEPPRGVMAYLKYESVEAMLAQEDIFELYAALRFIEGSEWLNSVFFRQYENLTPDDFEERVLTIRSLPEKWNAAAEKFVRKKWHNVSHLKELGMIFVIPMLLGTSGELLRMLSLVLHYFHEVPFYSDMFRRIARVPNTFAFHLISLLRGDTIERQLPDGEKTMWLVVQRYLAKDDENDWRLTMPRINPEAMHWLKAEEDLVKISHITNGFKKELAFWTDLDWVGDYFKDDIGNDVLVSFNLVDTVMSLVKEKELIKYLYHHKEAMWNKIFMEYLNREELEEFSKEYLLQGYFEI